MGIRVKLKICKSCKEERYIWSKGRCKPCTTKEDYSPIKSKKKTCIECQEEKFIYAKKMCQYCYSKSKSQKTPKFKRSTTKRHKTSKTKEYDAMRKFWKSQRDFEDNVHCEECLLEGKSRSEACIGHKFNPYNCAHILSKGADCSNRDNVDNFLMLCKDHHDMYDGQLNGKVRTDMLVWHKKAKEIVMKLKNKNHASK